MTVMIQSARLAFPNVFTPQRVNQDPNSQPKFSASFILPANSQQIQTIMQAMQQVAADKWQNKWEDVWKQLQAQGRIALRNGAEKASMDGFDESVVFFNASNTKRPGVYDRDRLPLTEADGKIYAGCYVNAVVQLWAQDNQYGKRVNASLRGIQFVDHGEAFAGGGAPAAAEEFPLQEDDGAQGGTPAPGGQGGDDMPPWLA